MAGAPGPRAALVCLMPLPAPRRSPPAKGSWTPVPAKCTAVGRFWAPVFLGPEGRAVSLVGAAVPAVRHPAESPPHTHLGEDRRAGELCCPLRSLLSLGFLRGGAGLGGVACSPPVWAGRPPGLALSKVGGTKVPPAHSRSSVISVSPGAFLPPRKSQKPGISCSQMESRQDPIPETEDTVSSDHQGESLPGGK